METERFAGAYFEEAILFAFLKFVHVVERDTFSIVRYRYLE